jgi:hypothetical protein
VLIEFPVIAEQSEYPPLLFSQADPIEDRAKMLKQRFAGAKQHERQIASARRLAGLVGAFQAAFPFLRITTAFHAVAQSGRLPR